MRTLWLRSRGTAIALLLLLGSCPASGAPTISAVVCGRDSAVVLADSSVYGPDQLYDGTNGYGALGGRPVEPHGLGALPDGRPAEEMDLFAQQRVGPAGYVFEVADGTYELTLHIATFQRDGPGISPMTVRAEGSDLFPSFDFLAESSKARPVDVRSLVTVTDGALTLEFSSPTGDHDLGAIALRPADPSDTLPPPPPQTVEAVDSYGGVLLRWDRVGATDLAGYRVSQDTPSGPRLIAPLRRIATIFVPTDTTTSYTVECVDLYGNQSPPARSNAAGPRPLDQSSLPRYHLYLDPADLTWLNEDPQQRRQVPGYFVYEGGIVPDVTLAYRGQSSRRHPKKSWNVDLGPFSFVHGSNDLILKAMWEDGTVQRELLTLDLLASAKIPAAAGFPVRLFVNDAYSGVYIDVERIDEHFVQRQGWSLDGRLYRAASTLAPMPHWTRYRDSFESVLVDDWDRADIISFVEGLRDVPEADILPWLESEVKLEDYLGLVCHQIVSANQDWNHDDYFLYRDPADRRWTVIPWDVGESWYLEYVDSPIVLGTREAPERGGQWNRLLDRVLHVPSLHRRYTERLRAYLDGHLHPDSIAAVFAGRTVVMWDDMIRDAAKLDLEFDDAYAARVDEVHAFIAQRKAEIERQLASSELPAHVLIQFSELLTANDGRVASVELVNLAPRVYSTTTLSLTNDPGDLTRWPIGPVTVPGRGHAVVALPDSLAAGEWLALTCDDGTHGIAVVDSITIPASISAQRTWGRYPDESGRWRLLDRATPDSANVWSSPIAVAATAAPPVVAPGGKVDLTVHVLNRGDDAFSGRALVTVRTRDGIRIGDGPVASRILVAAPAETTTVRLGLPVPTSGLEGYGYRLEVALVPDSDPTGTDRWAADTVEVFLEGPGAAPVVINEIMAVNDSTLMDEAGDFDDWVELVNTTAQEISVSGAYLSDDVEDDPFAWPLPATTLPPGGRLIVWCDGEPSEGPYHASFRLSGTTGDEVALTVRTPGNDPLVVDRWVFGVQEPDRSIGRFPDGQAAWVPMFRPTPGAPNRYFD